MTSDQIQAHALGIRTGCEMCSLHEVREGHLRSQIAELDRQMIVAGETEERLSKREDRFYLVIFALCVALMYFVAQAVQK